MCTRVLWNSSERGVYCGRNMDWLEDIGSNMWVLPRGMERNGATSVNPFTWTSTYGSLVLTIHDIGTADGINEAGLAVHLLYLPEMTTGKRDPDVPGMSVPAWPQWYLDSFKTVAEAVEASKDLPFQVRITDDPYSGKPSTIHLAIDDASGDTAILECIDGQLHIYHDRRYIVMTNQPTFDKQLENLKTYRGFGGDKPLPGTHEPSDRFVRSAYYVTHLPEPASERLAIASLMSVMRNAAAPFGISDPERPNVSTTLWRTVTNLTERVMYYDSVVSANVFWVDLDEFTLSPRASVKKLTIVDNFDLAGDVSSKFVSTEMFEFMPAKD